MVLTSFLGKIRSRCNRDALARRAARLVARFPRAWMAALVPLAVVGYLALVLFPLLAIVLGSSLPGALARAIDHGQWVSLLLQVVLLGIALPAIWRMVRFRVPLPEGRILDWEEEPAFINAVNELRDHYRAPAIDRVIVTGRFQVRLVRTPRFAVPGLYHTTLLAGVPLMHCLSAEQFRALVASHVGRPSGWQPRVAAWLTRLRDIWPQYCEFYGRYRDPASLALHWFLRGYRKLYDLLSLPVARADEVRSVNQALDHLADSDVAGLLSNLVVGQVFIEKHYWPRQMARLKKSPGAKLAPFATMAQAVRNDVGAEQRQRWIEQAFAAGPVPGDPAATLRQQLEGIGHTRPAMTHAVDRSAACHYLPDTLDKLNGELDAGWLKTIAPARAAAQNSRQNERRRLAKLQAQRERAALGASEAREYARLIASVHGPEAAIAVYQALLRQRPADGRLCYDAGRLLLAQNNPAGVPLINKAIKLEPRCIPAATRLLARFRSRQDQHAAAPDTAQAAH